MRKLTKTAAVVAAMATMAMGATVMTSAAQNGWVQSGANWYYYVNGEKVENQWAQAGDKWYFLGEDGKMLTNAFVNDGEEYVDDVEDINATDSDDAFYYVDSTGAMVTGWRKIDIKNLNSSSSTPKDSKKWYYFGGSGEMFGARWVQAGDKWYFLGENGIMVENDFNNDDDNNTGDYYLGDDGVLVSGWYKLSDDDEDAGLGEQDDWIYADDDEIITNGWKSIGGKWYYFGNNVTSAAVVSGSATQAVSTKYVMNEETFINTNNKWYYLKKNGAMETGWFTVKVDKESYKYYAKSNDGILFDGKVKAVSGKNYYFYNEEIDLDGDGKIGADDIYVGKYIDDDYVVTDRDGKNPLKDSTTGAVATFGTRSAAKAAAEADSSVPSNYKIYKLGTSTEYKETK